MQVGGGGAGPSSGLSFGLAHSLTLLYLLGTLVPTVGTLGKAAKCSQPE